MTSFTDRRGFIGGLAAAGLAGAMTQTAEARVVRVTAAPGYPNILLVDGIDVAGLARQKQDYRPLLKQAVYGATGLSVTRGSHDLWLSFPYPAQVSDNTSPPNFEFGDFDARGRKLLGIGDMRAIPGPDDMAKWLYLSLHEACHSWLVPRNLRRRMPDGTLVNVMSNAELGDALNRELPFTRPALIARQDCHWSAYVNFGSPMDAMQWSRAPAPVPQAGTLPDVLKYARWTQFNPSTAALRPAGSPALPDLADGIRLNDMELYLMGLKEAADCFPETGGQIYWMEPKLSRGPQMAYHTGLCVIDEGGNSHLLGFYNDHMRLRYEHTSGGVTASEALLSDTDYLPLRNDNVAVMLRVVHKGGNLHFQACRGNSAANALGALFGRTGVTMFAGDDTPEAAPVGGNLSQWQTLKTINGARPPKAIGIFTKTWGPAPILVEGRFFSFEIRKDGVERSFPMTQVQVQPEVPLVGISPLERVLNVPGLPGDRLVRHIPGDVLMRQRNGSLIFGVPLSGVYDLWNNIDRAPKVLTRAPDGDFSFGVSARVHRSLVGPAAGGFAANLTMWGVERSAHISEFPRTSQQSDRYLPDRRLRSAFMIATDDPDSIPAADYARLDALRRYYDEAVPVLTQGLLSSVTRL